MLTEQKPYQPSNQLKRRWFSDEYFDLIVWEDEHGEIVKFELCYDKERNEHSLCWSVIDEHEHFKVDDGEVYGRYKMSPIFVPDGYFDKKAIADRFINASDSIDQKVVKFIHQKILTYDINIKG